MAFVEEPVNGLTNCGWALYGSASGKAGTAGIGDATSVAFVGYEVADYACVWDPMSCAELAQRDGKRHSVVCKMRLFQFLMDNVVTRQRICESYLNTGEFTSPRAP